MSDNEIKKALEKMTYGGHSCMHCEYGTTKGDYICGLQGCKIGRDALDLINRQQAEIEKLKDLIKSVNEDIGKAIISFDKDIATAKTEAVKEFAERLIEKIDMESELDDYEAIIVKNHIAGIASKMTESSTKIEHSSLCETDTYEVKE